MTLYGLLGLQLDNFFYQQYLNEKITGNKILDVLDKLEHVNAITPERKSALSLRIW